jgi:hypothetical protein
MSVTSKAVGSDARADNSDHSSHDAIPGNVLTSTQLVRP